MKGFEKSNCDLIFSPGAASSCPTPPVLAGITELRDHGITKAANRNNGITELRNLDSVEQLGDNLVG